MLATLKVLLWFVRALTRGLLQDAALGDADCCDVARYGC